MKTSLPMKELIMRAVENLPQEATFDEAIERIYLFYKIQRGIEAAEAGETVSQEEARRRLGAWLE